MRYSKLIIFDLDGVLVDTCEMHYETLNEVLSKIDSKYVILKKEHIDEYNGLPTKTKLEMLSFKKNLPRELHQFIWDEKQRLTKERLSKESINDSLVEVFSTLKQNGVILHVASNATLETVNILLVKKGLINFIDHILAREDVNRPKPNPEIYLRSMAEAGIGPKDTIIVEDSEVGLEAATASGAVVKKVSGPHDISCEFLMS